MLERIIDLYIDRLDFFLELLLQHIGITLISVAIMWFFGWKLNVLSMGDEEARALSVNPEVFKFIVIVLATLVTAICVSSVGIVAWVGLMMPHAARLIQGPDNRFVIPTAALMGGVAGNAGLFANAQSVGVLMQMLLNGGSYAGKQYISKATVDVFTKAPISGIRRGLVFDKPETNPAKGSPTCKSASPQTFGHQGFTGTCTWADPSNKLVYVFLSNRIYPTASNQKISKLSVRTEIQQVFYDCLRKIR